jgi:hypothetical protein
MFPSLHASNPAQPFMNANINQIQQCDKESSDVPIDLEFELYLFDLYVNDHIENQLQRLLEDRLTDPLNHFTDQLISTQTKL